MVGVCLMFNSLLNKIAIYTSFPLNKVLSSIFWARTSMNHPIPGASHLAEQKYIAIAQVKYCYRSNSILLEGLHAMMS